MSYQHRFGAHRVATITVLLSAIAFQQSTPADAGDLRIQRDDATVSILDGNYPERVFGGGGTFEYHREVPDQCNMVVKFDKQTQSIVL